MRYGKTWKPAQISTVRTPTGFLAGVQLSTDILAILIDTIILSILRQVLACLGHSPTIGAAIVAIVDGMSCMRFLPILLLKIFTDTGLDVTNLGKSPQLHIKIFVDDEKLLRREMELDNDSSTYKITQPIDL
jgi:hypothetical protein